jgi:predicted Zn-dependent protease
MIRTKQPYKLVNAIAVAFLLVNAGCSSDSGDPAKAAQTAMASYDYENARIHLANALKADPSNPALIFMNGKLALASGNPELAKGEFTKLLSNADYGKKALSLLAKAQLMGGNADLALATLAKSTALDDIGYAATVGAKMAKGESEGAIAALDAGLAAFPESLDLRILDGSRALASGDFAKAEATADKLLLSAPNDPDALLYAGRVAFSQKKFAVAETRFNAILKSQPGHQSALLSLSAMARDKGDMKAATAFLEKARSVSPGNPVTIYLLAQMAFDAGDTKRAADLMQGTGEVQEQLPALMMLNGLIAAKQGKTEQAIVMLRNFLASGGEDGRARVALATALDSSGDKAGAWMVLRPVADAANASAPVLTLASRLATSAGAANAGSYTARAAQASNPDPIASQMKAADAAIQAGDWKKVDAVYTGLLARGNETNIILLNNAANAKLELGDGAGAIALARRAYAVAPNDPLVLDTLGWSIFKGQGDSPEVTALLDKAIKAMPGNAEIRAHIVAVSAARSKAKPAT